MEMPQVHASHYLSVAYDHKARWISYWQQIREIIACNPRTVLEVGGGSRITSTYLAARGVEVKTVDIDPELKPDFVASVRALPLPDASWDVVCAFEVLEHLSFEEFVPSLKEMARVSKRWVIISLPDSRHTLLHGMLKFPLLPRMELFLKIQSLRRHTFDGQHYWEPGTRNFSFRRIRAVIAQSGLQCVRDYVMPECPTKHFFVLCKPV